MDEISITDLIDPHKDVDGFTRQNLGRLVQGDVVVTSLRSSNADARKYKFRHSREEEQ